LKFPSWKKEKSSTSKEEENMLNEETAAQSKTEDSQTDIATKETIIEQPSQINVETPKEEQKTSTKLEDNRNYIVKIITKAGIPLVIRSEQNIIIQEEVRNEISLLLDENKALMEEILKSDRHVADDDEYLLRTANFHYLLGNTEKAMELYDRVLKRNPCKMTALNNKGVMLDSTGKYDEAVEYFNKALSSVPENVHVLCNKGITLYKNGKYEEALGCFDSVLELESNYVNALTFKGHTLYRLGKNNDALASYSKVIRIDQSNAEALYNKACLCSLKGDEYGALTSLERAIRLDPSWKAAALVDKDLERIKNNPRFSELVQSSN
jgi:tetratricopeptide (TPR) repeat protein